MRAAVAFLTVRRDCGSGSCLLISMHSLYSFTAKLRLHFNTSFPLLQAWEWGGHYPGPMARYTALHMASVMGSVGNVAALLQQGARVDTPTGPCAWEMDHFGLCMSRGAAAVGHPLSDANTRFYTQAVPPTPAPLALTWPAPP